VSPSERAETSAADPLADLPIHSDGPPGRFAEPLAARGADVEGEAAAETASLTSRAVAFAADLAGTSLAVTLALVAAVAVTGRAPRLTGISWAAAFGVVYSFVFVALPLTLFGRTVGMSLAGLAARHGASGRGLTPSEAAKRWAGTAVSAIALGLPLLVTMRDPLRPTPADRFSGRPLVRESEAS
jgi:hypothetical protein